MTVYCIVWREFSIVPKISKRKGPQTLELERNIGLGPWVRRG